MGIYERDYGRDEGYDYGNTWRPEAEKKPRSAAVVLVIINVVVFLVDFIVAGGTLSTFFGTTSNTLIKPWMAWQFLTYGFIHDPNDILHLVFNMIVLFFFGRSVEERIGCAEFVRFYLAAIFFSGFIASCFYFARGEQALIVGASGGVVATTILFALYFPQVEVLLFGVLPIKAWVLAAMMVSLDFLGAAGVLGSATAPEAGKPVVRTAFEVHLCGAGFAALYFYHWISLGWLAELQAGDWGKQLRNRSRRMRLKIHNPERKLREEEEEADRILAKIHSQGESSLTSSERKLLERYSRRQREKRQQNRPK
jgi:membrane associated rhomboid family serine protease